MDRLALEYGLRVHEIEDTEHLAEARSYSHANDLTEGRHLEGRPLMIATTAGNTPEAYRHGGGNLMPVADLLAPLRATAHRCRLVWAEPFVVYRADKLTQQQLDATADDYCAALIRWTDTSARKAA